MRKNKGKSEEKNIRASFRAIHFYFGPGLAEGGGVGVRGLAGVRRDGICCYFGLTFDTFSLLMLGTNDLSRINPVFILCIRRLSFELAISRRDFFSNEALSSGDSDTSADRLSKSDIFQKFPIRVR